MRFSSALLFASLALSVTACATDEDGELHCDEHGEECADDASLFEAAHEENLLEGKEDGTDCSGVRVPDQNGFNKRIALTFDDGPNPATTPKVIQVLKAHNAPAAFFTNGSKYGSAAAKAIAMQVAADPQFILANHSQNHLNLATLGLTTVAAEMDKTDALVRAAGEIPKFFRFPFGSANCAAKKLATDRGWTVTGWHIDSADWCYAAGAGTCKKATFKYVPDELRGDMLAYIKSQVRATNGGVILFHDIHANTANNLDRVLTALEQDGYTFVRLDDTAAFPKLNGAPVPVNPAKFIGDKCITDAQCGFTASGQAGRCHAAGFCTISCAGACPDLVGKAGTFCIADASSSTGGTCVSKAAQQNSLCTTLTGTVRGDRDRFGGVPARMNVCAPR